MFTLYLTLEATESGLPHCLFLSSPGHNHTSSDPRAYAHTPVNYVAPCPHTFLSSCLCRGDDLQMSFIRLDRLPITGGVPGHCTRKRNPRKFYRIAGPFTGLLHNNALTDRRCESNLVRKSSSAQAQHDCNIMTSTCILNGLKMSEIHAPCQSFEHEVLKLTRQLSDGQDFETS